MVVGSFTKNTDNFASLISVNIFVHVTKSM